MKRIIPFILAAVCFAKPALPASGGSAEVTKKHEKVFASIENLTVQFTQTSYRKMRNNTKTRSGTAYFAKPGKFRWDFQDKGEMVESYLFDGKLLSHYVKADNTVTHYATQSKLSQELHEVVNMVLDANSLQNQYNVTVIDESKNAAIVSLKPKKPKDTEIKEITLKLSEERNYVKFVKIEYLDGNYTQFDFKNPRFEALTNKTFQFTNPGKVIEKKVG